MYFHQVSTTLFYLGTVFNSNAFRLRTLQLTLQLRHLMSQLVPDGIKIPGVSDTSAFVNWIVNLGITWNEKVTIENSKLGGMGLFYTPDAKEDGKEEKLLLRIPSSSKLTIYSLLDTLTKLKQRDVNCFPDHQLKESSLVVAFLDILKPKTETLFLISYILAFSALSNDPESPLREYDTYMDILEATFVPDETTVSEESQFKECLRSYMQWLYKEYTNLSKQLKDRIPDFDVNEMLPFSKYYQLFQAVRSRTLEIPRSLENESESSSNSTEFTTDVSLVPILDFVNHSSDNNAYFDIDRENNDIILKLERLEKKDKKFEVTIQYQQEDHDEDFFLTYVNSLADQGDGQGTATSETTIVWITTTINGLSTVMSVLYTQTFMSTYTDAAESVPSGTIGLGSISGTVGGPRVYDQTTVTNGGSFFYSIPFGIAGISLLLGML
ncbi:CTM1 [Candida oxycetoniae]|uniref:CTM1 n=1 Tax=Candida oxycetoniae TaxID=497107 RepID=A0AAI9T1N6_9ASCO|nr:CTM1 [Candida oxycetoniae]KAI3406994.2 CTM1 [Candida oxycetoniae]